MKKNQITQIIGKDVTACVRSFKIYMTHASEDSFFWSRTDKTGSRSCPNYALYDKMTFDEDIMCISKNNHDVYININYISAIVVNKFTEEK